MNSWEQLPWCVVCAVGCVDPCGKWHFASPVDKTENKRIFFYSKQQRWRRGNIWFACMRDLNAWKWKCIMRCNIECNGDHCHMQVARARALKARLHSATPPHPPPPPQLLQQIKEKVSIYECVFMNFKSLICEQKIIHAIITCSDTECLCTVPVCSVQERKIEEMRFVWIQNSCARKYATLKMLMMIHRTHGPRGS